MICCWKKDPRWFECPEIWTVGSLIMFSQSQSKSLAFRIFVVCGYTHLRHSKTSFLGCDHYLGETSVAWKMMKATSVLNRVCWRSYIVDSWSIEIKRREYKISKYFKAKKMNWKKHEFPGTSIYHHKITRKTLDLVAILCPPQAPTGKNLNNVVGKQFEINYHNFLCDFLLWTGNFYMCF